MTPAAYTGRESKELSVATTSRYLRARPGESSAGYLDV